jgi:MSHA biogenesis protein MshO
VPTTKYLTKQRGFTLVELVMVIVILGVLGAIVAVFMRSPIDAYFASARRAALTDVADTVVRRMARDIQRALPNSVRQANNQCLEFIPTRTGGRYRAMVDGTGAGDALDFSIADGSFDMLGTNSAASGQTIVVGDLVAIYNLGIGDADAYNANNTSPVTDVLAGSLAGETKIEFTAKKFPLASGSQRFQIIPGEEKVVAYVCRAGNLFRVSNHAYTPSCPATGGTLIAQNVSCAFTYSGSDLQRNALVKLNMGFTDSSGEAVSLYHEVHVNNTP